MLNADYLFGSSQCVIDLSSPLCLSGLVAFCSAEPTLNIIKCYENKGKKLFCWQITLSGILIDLPRDKHVEVYPYKKKTCYFP